MTPTDVREIEWQFDALDLRPVQRWLAEPGGWGDAVELRIAASGSESHIDLYLDTDDWRFHRAGYALRIRRPPRRVRGGEATLKALASAGSAAPGLRRRREVSEQLEHSDPAALASLGGLIGERVRAVAGTKPLLPLFEIRTRRKVFLVEGDGIPAAEIALDETAIHPTDGASPARMRRVEIELPERAVARLEPFVERLRTACGLQPAGLSKYEAGLLSADLRAPGPESFGVTTVDPDAPIGAVAVAVLRRHFSALLAHEPGTRLGDDIEELHDMRVASRRLRAALSLFAEVLPPDAARLREELGWIAGALGDVRDLDVQLEELDGWLRGLPQADREPLAALRGLLEAKRSDARAALLEALDARRYEAFVSRFGRTLRARPRRLAGPAALPARAVAPDLLQSRFRKLRVRGDRIGPASDPSDYHRLRIDAKRLRYALEFLGDVYPAQTPPLVKRIVALQDLLGRHQDAEVAIGRLRTLVTEHADELQPTTIFAMGEIAERYRQTMTALRAQFPPVYARVKGRSWKSLRKVLDQQRPQVPVVRADADRGPPVAG
jgi:CHAD domain-containing protein